MSLHREGRPVSASTYTGHGCRCEGCTEAAAEYMRQARRKRGGALLKVQHRRQTLAIAWLRREHPEVWAELHQQAYDELGIERRSPGRPSSGTAIRRVKRPGRAVHPEFVKVAAVIEYLNGEGSVAIGQRYGVGPPTVLRWARQAGLDIRPVGRPRRAEAS